MAKTDSSLNPANIFVSPKSERFQDDYRRWQGIPSIETSKNGRIFINFYTGQAAEVGGNFLMLCVSALKLYRVIVKDDKNTSVKQDVIRHTMFCLILLIPLGIASLIEAYVSTELLMFFTV